MRRIIGRYRVVAAGMVFAYLLLASVKSKFERDTPWLPLIVLTVIVAAWWGIRYYRGWAWPKTPFDGPILVGIGALALSVLANLGQIDRMLVWLWYLGAALGVFYLASDVFANRASGRREVFDMILVAGIPILSAAYAQAVTLTQQGFSPRALIGQRLYGDLAHPNNLAVFLVLSITLAAGRVTITRQQWLRGLLYGYAALSLVMLLWTGSRNGWISLLIGLGVWLLLRRGISPAGIVLGAGVALLALGLAFLLRRNDIRLALYHAALVAFAEKPLTGYGPFSYQVRLAHVYPRGVDAAEVFYYQAHNLPLQVAAELGVPGLTALGLMLWTLIRAARARLRETMGDDRALCMSGIAALAGSASLLTFDNVTMNVPGMGAAMLLLVALTTLPGSPPPRRRPLIPALIAGLWLVLLFAACRDQGAHMVYWTSFADPARRITLAFDSMSVLYTDPVGWHAAEINAAGQMYQWTRAPQFSITVPLPADADASIRFRIVASAAPDVLDSLALAVNGDPVALTRQPEDSGALLFSGLIPQASLAKNPGSTRLAFSTTRVVSPLALGAGEDSRPLGVAFNWLQIEPAPSPASLLIIEFDGDERAPLLETGWHAPETSPDGLTFRWTGGERAIISARLAADRDLRIRLRALYAAAPDILDSLTLWVNGDQIALVRAQENSGAVLISGLIPKESLARSAGLARLEVRTARVASPQLHSRGSGTPDDRRSLGVALDWLRIEPADDSGP